jgi:predicted AAA+ superfamily ATPase
MDADLMTIRRLYAFNQTPYRFHLVVHQMNQAAKMYPRWIEERVRNEMSDTRVVLLSGPRQAGKTTLAKKAAEKGATFLTLDDPTTLSAAKSDPVAFIRGLDRATIDEIQRAPELVLAIKRSVDEDTRPGRFLLTGSANLLTIPTVADSLAGRMAIVDLLPLSISEIRRRPSRFLDEVFRGNAPKPSEPIIGEDLVTAVLTGGYPEVLLRNSWNRRRDWCLNYVRAIIERDVRDVAQIEKAQQLPRLLRVLAHHSGQLVNYSGLGSPLGLTHVTTQKYAGIFGQLFLTSLLQPWSRNELKRLIKTPKLHFLDSGLLAALRDLSPQRLASDRGAFGSLLETFVLSEVLKLASWTGMRYSMSHYRDKEQNEVDIVIEDQAQRTVGLEVKAGATVTSADFGGLRKLAEASGKYFVLGLVLYDGDTVVPFGPNLFATPISSLWG